MKIYKVLNKKGEVVGSRNKKFFSNMGHIKTSGLKYRINSGEYTLLEYDLTKVEPTQIKKL